MVDKFDKDEKDLDNDNFIREALANRKKHKPDPNTQAGRRDLTLDFLSTLPNDGFPDRTPTEQRAETLGIVDFIEKGKKIDPRKMRTDGFDKGTITARTGEAGFVDGAFISDKNRKEFAKGGFMGTVDMKTMFTVGEGNKKEHVTKKKKNNIFDVGFKF